MPPRNWNHGCCYKPCINNLKSSETDLNSRWRLYALLSEDASTFGVHPRRVCGAIRGAAAMQRRRCRRWSRRTAAGTSTACCRWWCAARRDAARPRCSAGGPLAAGAPFPLLQTIDERLAAVTTPCAATCRHHDLVFALASSAPCGRRPSAIMLYAIKVVTSCRHAARPAACKATVGADLFTAQLCVDLHIVSTQVPTSIPIMQLLLANAQAETSLIKPRKPPALHVM